MYCQSTEVNNILTIKVVTEVIIVVAVWILVHIAVLYILYNISTRIGVGTRGGLWEGRGLGPLPPGTFCAKLYITITKVKSLATPSNFQFAPNATDSCICINIKLSLHQILDFSASFKHYELKKRFKKTTKR